jgi:uncharacterized membrane protein HdeD (DUF308 family)
MSKSKNPLAKGTFWLGLLSIFLGILLITSPQFAILLSVSVELLIGFLFFIGGVVQFIFSFKEKGGTFWLLFLLSILFVIIGLFLIFNPLKGVLTLTVLLSIFFFVGGILKIVFAFAVSPGSRWPFVVSGIASIVIAILIWSAWPISGIWFIGFLIGVDMFLLGISQIITSFISEDETGEAKYEVETTA